MASQVFTAVAHGDDCSVAVTTGDAVTVADGAGLAVDVAVSALWPHPARTMSDKPTAAATVKVLMRVRGARGPGWLQPVPDAGAERAGQRDPRPRVLLQ